MLNLINPKLALTLIQKEIVSHVRHEVDKYEMIFKGQTNEILFKVFAPDKIELPPEYSPETRSRVYTWNDSEMIAKTLSPMLKEKLKKNERIDLAVICWGRYKENIEVTIAYTNEQNEKLKLTETL